MSSDGTRIGSLKQVVELRARIAELERERDQYHDALIARHGGEPVALLAELDEARARVAELEADLERMTAARNRDHQQALMNGAALAAERERREAAEALLLELVAVVRGECPSLLDEDSGGDARTSVDIDAHFARYKKEPT